MYYRSRRNIQEYSILIAKGLASHPVCTGAHYRGDCSDPRGKSLELARTLSRGIITLYHVVDHVIYKFTGGVTIPLPLLLSNRD